MFFNFVIDIKMGNERLFFYLRKKINSFSFNSPFKLSKRAQGNICLEHCLRNTDLKRILENDNTDWSCLAPIYNYFKTRHMHEFMNNDIKLASFSTNKLVIMLWTQCKYQTVR
jgi:hypothetical protein